METSQTNSRLVKRRKKGDYSLREGLFIALVFAATATFSAVAAYFYTHIEVYKINTESMFPAINPGDYVIAVSVKYKNKEDWRDQIVAINQVEFADSNSVFIKRVFALEGDTVRVSKDSLSNNAKSIPFDLTAYQILQIMEYKGGFRVYFEYLYLNNFDLKERKKREKIEEDYFVMPQNSLFVVGDNYEESMDSRFWGFIHKDQVIGKIKFVF